MLKVTIPKITLPKIGLGSANLPGYVRDTAPDYINDGLVFWLDGIDKGGTHGKWVDLIGGVEFQNHGATAIGKGWRFDKSADDQPQYLDSETRLNYPVATHSVEVCFRYGEWEASALLFATNIEGSIAAGYIKGGLFSFRHGDPRGSFVFAPDKEMAVSISAAANNGIANGAPLQFTDIQTWDAASYPHIGWRGYGSSVFIGEIYSIRVYNRLLSAEEMRHNQKVDARRFGLSLEPVATLEYNDVDLAKLDGVS